MSADQARGSPAGQQVPGDRGCGALALVRSRTAPAQIGFGEHRPRPPTTGCPARTGGHLGPVPAQARRLHHHVASFQARARLARSQERRRRGGEWLSGCEWSPGAGGHRQDWLDAQRASLRRLAWPRGPAPDPDSGSGQVRPGEFGSWLVIGIRPDEVRGDGVSMAAASAARRRVGTGDLAPPVPAADGPVAPVSRRAAAGPRPALADLADALERLGAAPSSARNFRASADPQRSPVTAKIRRNASAGRNGARSSR